jgi:hypothetical protein
MDFVRFGYTVNFIGVLGRNIKITIGVLDNSIGAIHPWYGCGAPALVIDKGITIVGRYIKIIIASFNNAISPGNSEANSVTFPSRNVIFAVLLVTDHNRWRYLHNNSLHWSPVWRFKSSWLVVRRITRIELPSLE